MTDEPVHPILRAALASLARPLPVSGPRPELRPDTQARLVLRVALVLLDRLPADEARDRTRERLAARLAQLDEPSAAIAFSFRHPYPWAGLAEKVLVQSAGPASVLRRLVKTFVGQVARAWPGSADELIALLENEIAQAELRSLPQRQAGDLVAGVLLLRGGEPAARPLLWLVRKPDGGLVLLLRQQGRLARIEGRDEDVLASVPDAWFAAAVAAAAR